MAKTKPMAEEELLTLVARQYNEALRRSGALDYNYAKNNSLAHLSTKGEEEMDTNYDQRQHLKYRLREVESDRKLKAKETFGLVDQESPQSFADLQARLASGMFVVNEKEDAQKYGPFYAVRWRDPAVKEDRPGYDTWKKSEAPKRQAVSDDIAIKDPKEALESLRAYEASSIQ